MEIPRQPSTQTQYVSIRTVLLLGTTLLCIIFLAGGAMFYYYGPCGISRVKTAGLTLADHAQTYIGRYKIAEATPRIALAGPITDLQDLKREIQLTQVPACMGGAKSELVQVVDNSIQGLVAFMGQDDTMTDFYINESTNHIAEFRTQMELVEQCKPFCQAK